MTPGPRLSDFTIALPRYEQTQRDALAWIAAAHARAEGTEAFGARIRTLLDRFGCSPEKLGRRRYDLEDFNHERWDEMEIFRLGESPRGAGLETRMRAYDRFAGRAFDALYAESREAPSALVHVTCTGYLSPSPAQKLVQARNWSGVTEVTHAYHMGCYAAIPAVRIAAALHGSKLRKSDGPVDVVHTELCTLHLDPADHSPEQLVVQGLFADGSIRYRIGEARGGLEILALREELIAGTGDQMSWAPGSFGFRMSLSPQLPVHVARALPGFVSRLTQGEACDPMIWAVHPGGPRVIDAVQETCGLKDEQLAQSREVLYERGNMSSATLPHIWEKILHDERVPSGTRVLSLAFGPGLTLCGALFRKECR